MKITTKLILSLLIVSILPLVVVGNIGLQSMGRVSSVALDKSTEVLKQSGETSIHQKAVDVARQLELYLDSHPELLSLPAKELEANQTLAALAVQPVGKTGYTAVYDSDGIDHFHTNPAIVGTDLRQLAGTLPKFWAILEASLDGTVSAGYYEWKDADGTIREKYMSCVPVGNTRLRVAATTYIDEFYQPLRDTEARIAGISKDMQRYLIAAMALSGIGAVLAAALLATLMIRPLRRITEGARRFSEGKLDQEIHADTRDEIGLLAATLNQMAQDLKRRWQEKDQDTRQLNDLNQRMEQQITELERRAAELQVLHEFTLRANAQTDTAELLRLTSEQAVALLGAEAGGVYVYDSQLDRLTLSVAVGPLSDFVDATLKPGEGLVGKAFESRHAMTMEDYSSGAERPVIYEQESRFKATLAVPLMGKEGVLGVLDIGGGTQKPAFDDRDVRLAELFSAQAAGALENLRLLQQTQTALKELEASSRLLARQGWQGYLEQKITQRAEFRAASAPVQDPRQGKAEPQSEPLRVPLELRGQPLGRLTLHREDDRPWSDDEIEMIKAVALQTMLAADNARLVEQTQMALRETEGLFKAAVAIAGPTDLREICQNLTSHFCDLVQADRTLLTLVDQQRKQILLRVGHGNITEELQMTFEELSAGLGGRVIATGQPALSVTAWDKAESEATRERRWRLNIGSLIVTPLITKGVVIGIVGTYRRTDQRPFTQHDVELLMALTAQAATAVENVRLLEETQRRAERERLIRQITTRIRAAGDIQGVLEVTATELARSLGVSRSIVRLTMGDKDAFTEKGL